MVWIDARGHGGDAGGDPPHGHWQPPFGCKASGPGKRGPGQNIALEKKYKKNNYEPLEISFDIRPGGTFAAVGPNADNLKSLIGNLARGIPLRFPSWTEVPGDRKANVWPTIQQYFDFGPFMDPPVNELISKGVTGWVELQFTRAYRDAKNKFKKKHFFDPSERGTNIDTIRGMPPAPLDMVEWGAYVDYYCSESGVRRAAVNRANRRQQPHITTQWRKSFVEIRYDGRNPDGSYPTMIEVFRQTHMHKNGTWSSPLAQEQHAEMALLWDQRAANGMTEQQIMSQVLGQRRGWVRGVGPVVSATHQAVGAFGASQAWGAWGGDEETEGSGEAGGSQGASGSQASSSQGWMDLNNPYDEGSDDEDGGSDDD